MVLKLEAIVVLQHVTLPQIANQNRCFKVLKHQQTLNEIIMSNFFPPDVGLNACYD